MKGAGQMIPIYICEDKQELLEFERKFIENYCVMHQYNFKIVIHFKKGVI